MRRMAAYPAYSIPAGVKVDYLLGKTRADVAEHGGVVWVGNRGRQARQARRLQAAARADGYPTEYRTGAAGQQILIVHSPGREPPRADGWWGRSN